MMKSSLKLLFVMVLLFGFRGTPMRADDICTANPDSRFTNNYNPIARFGGGCFAADSGCSCTTSAANCGVVLDVTPRDASNTPTNTHGAVNWTCTGFEIGNTTGDRCFHPRGRYTGAGTASCTVTADNGVSYTFTFGTGGGTTTTPPNPTATFVPGDPGENDTYCAYAQGSSKICLYDTQGATQTECSTNATCTSKGGCQVTERKDCTNPQPSLLTFTVNDLPPGDLGAFIKRIFDFSLSIVGLTVFVAVIYGGFLMLLAGGLPSMHAKGKEVITNAFFGALLLFAAYVILNTVNPNLVKQKGVLPPLPSQQVPPPPR